MKNQGPDGWRYGVVKWAKSVKSSRLPHYFVSGGSLCGKHFDGFYGYYPEALKEAHPSLRYPCKVCRRRLDKLEKEGIKPSFHHVLRPKRVV